MNIDELKEIVWRFDNARVLVIGDLMLDKFVQGTVSRLSPEAPVPVVDVISETFRPGGAANAISNIRALGGDVVAVGVIGDDWNGRKLIELLKQDNVDTECIIVSEANMELFKFTSQNDYNPDKLFICPRWPMLASLI